MASYLIERATQLETELRGAGINAHVDVAGVVNTLPGVLITPPILDDAVLGGSSTFIWRLILLAAQPLGSLASFEQLAELLDQLADAGVPFERAEPISYALPALGGDPLPAYAVTLTGS